MCGQLPYRFCHSEWSAIFIASMSLRAVRAVQEQMNAFTNP
jgi:hypothetical protein